MTSPNTKNPIKSPNAVESALMSYIAESVCLLVILLNKVFLKLE